MQPHQDPICCFSSSCWTHCGALEEPRGIRKNSPPKKKIKNKKISQTRLAIKTAAGRDSHTAQKKRHATFALVSKNADKHADNPAWNFLFLSQRSNAPQIRFDPGAALRGGGKSVNRAEPSLTGRPLSAAPANISSNAGRASRNGSGPRVRQDQRERRSDAAAATVCPCGLVAAALKTEAKNN